MRIAYWSMVTVVCLAIGITIMAIGDEVYGADALRNLNWRRQQVGLPAYKADPVLQAAAERSAQAQASRGRMRHCNHIGNRSGVGMTSRRDPTGRRFHTCYSMGRGTAWAGAAAAVGRNGQTYYALDLSNSPRGRSRSTAAPSGKNCYLCPKCGRTHCR